MVPSLFGDGEVFANGTLLLRDITETMAGKYSCAATNKINSVQANTYVFVMCMYIKHFGPFLERSLSRFETKLYRRIYCESQKNFNFR